jgi:HSP20 family protein
MSQTACCEPTTARDDHFPMAVVTPRADGWETADAYVLSVEMPGVDEGHLDITLEKNIVSMIGSADVSRYDGLKPVAGAVRPRRYERSFRLPDGIDVGQLDASIQNGVVTLRLPKSQQSLRRKITVRPA